MTAPSYGTIILRNSKMLQNKTEIAIFVNVSFLLSRALFLSNFRYVVQYMS